MSEVQFFPTSAKLISENYPYGFKLRTTKTDFLEFSPKHGFRHCSFTVNPKTGRVNATKKSTYYPGMLLYRDENGHTKSTALHFYGDDGMQFALKFLAEKFHFFTQAEIAYFYSEIYLRSKSDLQARVIYTGADFKDLKPIAEKYLPIIAQGMKSKGAENLFSEILKNWDFQALENCSKPDFKPFVSSGPVSITSMMDKG